MLTQKTALDFKGQNIFDGIDVHLESRTVTILTEELLHETFTQPPCADTLCNYLNRNFPGWNYHSDYESGFCGFWTHCQLKAMGIDNIVTNPADVPTCQKEKLQKNDPTDSRKLARSLRANELKAIYVPEPATLDDRSLIRMRATLVKE